MESGLIVASFRLDYNYKVFAIEKSAITNLIISCFLTQYVLKTADDPRRIKNLTVIVILVAVVQI